MSTPLAIYLIVTAISIAALWSLLPRAGMSPWLAIMGIVPALTLVLLFIVVVKLRRGEDA
jgi:hypothetical protein